MLSDGFQQNSRGRSGEKKGESVSRPSIGNPCGNASAKGSMNFLHVSAFSMRNRYAVSNPRAPQTFSLQQNLQRLIFLHRHRDLGSTCTSSLSTPSLLRSRNSGMIVLSSNRSPILIGLSSNGLLSQFCHSLPLLWKIGQAGFPIFGGSTGPLVNPQIKFSPPAVQSNPGCHLSTINNIQIP